MGMHFHHSAYCPNCRWFAIFDSKLLDAEILSLRCNRCGWMDLIGSDELAICFGCVDHWYENVCRAVRGAASNWQIARHSLSGNSPAPRG